MEAYVWWLTLIHTVVSFIAMGFGFGAVARLFGADFGRRWTKCFFVTATFVTLTGFIFPFTGVTPAFATGIVATVIFLAWLLARYRFRLVGLWRSIYAASIVASLYLLVFVTIAQAFQKIPFLSALAPTQSEAPFTIAQAVAVVLFIIVGVIAMRRFRPMDVASA
jgi:hypothetical protein